MLLLRLHAHIKAIRSFKLTIQNGQLEGLLSGLICHYALTLHSQLMVFLVKKLLSDLLAKS